MLSRMSEKPKSSFLVEFGHFISRTLYFTLPFSFVPPVIALYLAFYSSQSILKAIFPAFALLFGIVWGIWMLAKRGVFPGSCIAIHQCALVLLLTCLSSWEDTHRNIIYLFYAHCVISSFFYVLVEDCVNFSKLRIIIPNIISDTLILSSILLIIFGSQHFAAFTTISSLTLTYVFGGLLFACFYTFYLVHSPFKSISSVFSSIIIITYCLLLTFVFSFIHARYDLKIVLLYYPIFVFLSTTNIVLLIKYFQSKKQLVQKKK